MDNKETVCAVVVTYNRKELLLECLEALRNQSYPLDAIYLIDNASTDNTPELLLNNGFINELPLDSNGPWERCSKIQNLTDNKDIKLHYVRMPKNMGGAGGFYEGVKKACQKGYDWLWLMDDDSEPDKHALQLLAKHFNEDSLSALGNAVKNVKGGIEGHSGYSDFKKPYRSFFTHLKDEKYVKSSAIHVDFTSFAGMMVRRSTINKVGYPQKKFFIHHDDSDYCIRLNRFGRILLITDSYIIHKDEYDSIPLKKIGRFYYAMRPFSSYWLFYYTIRNTIYLGKTYSINRAHFYLCLFFDYLKHLMGIILFDDNKLKRINLITNAYLDGLNGNFDNDKPRRILY